MNKYTLKILSIIEESSDIKTYILQKPEGLSWSEGAHAHIGIKGFDEVGPPIKDLVRHMSISTLPCDDCIGITTRVPGSHSQFKQKLSQLGIGDELVLFKFGSRMELRREDRPLVLLSMGVGASTFRPLIQRFVQEDDFIPHLTHINVQSGSLPTFFNQLQRIQTSHLTLMWATHREEFYRMLHDVMNSSSDAIYYVVGSDVFLYQVVQFLKQHHIAMDDIILDKKAFELMRYYSGSID